MSLIKLVNVTFTGIVLKTVDMFEHQTTSNVNSRLPCSILGTSVPRPGGYGKNVKSIRIITNKYEFQPNQI